MDPWIEQFYAIAGFGGVAFYLGSYAALQLGFLNGQGYAYAFLNVIAASCVLISLIEAFNLSSALIQGFWIFISAVGIARYYYLTHRIKFTDEEAEFLQTALPEISKIKARKLLDLGFWITGEPGAVLTEEGKTVEHLIYLASGQAEVQSGEKVIAVCEERSFVGEITALSGEGATASVVLAAPSRYLAIPAERLRDVLRRDGEIRANIEACVAGQVMNKLKLSNQALAQAAETPAS